MHFTLKYQTESNSIIYFGKCGDSTSETSNVDDEFPYIITRHTAMQLDFKA